MSGKPDLSAKREPFHCGSCGQPVPDLKACVWDSSIQVGSCCETYIDHRCPDCGSDNLDYREYDYGCDSETSYHDAGVRAICQECGCNCDERDTEVKIVPTQFQLTPPNELRAPHRITSRPVCPSAPEFIRKEIA